MGDPLRSVRISIFCALLLCSFGSAQTSSQNSTTNICPQTAAALPHGNALESFCAWVLSFDTRLPNIIGDQHTQRFKTDNGKDRNLIDTTGARIAYIGGRPRFSDVTINRVPVAQNGDLPELLQIYGAWSYGDYGTDLRLLFRPDAHAQFHFDGESTWAARPVLIFSFEVSAADNLRWEMKAREKTGGQLLSTFPAYRGRIFLDPQSFELVRFERETVDVEKHFPLRYGSNRVDYRRLPLGDGTSFVLPVESVVTFCHDDKHHRCDINDTTFANWQKFGATTRIITGETH